MKIEKPNLSSLKSINKDKIKIAVFAISFFDSSNSKQNENKLKPIIKQIDETGPCENFLKENDLILEINKKKIKNVKDFFNVQKKLKPNEIVIIRVKRRNQELNRAIRTISLYEWEKPRQKHTIRLGIFFDPEEQKKTLRVIAVQKKFTSDKIIQPEDIILEINNIQVKNREQLDCELKKVTWGNKIKIKINRKNKILVKEVKTTSFEDYKKRLVMFEVKTKLIKKKFLKITHITDSSFNQTQIKKGDIILSIQSKVLGIKYKKKLKSQEELYREIHKFEPTQTISLEIYRNGKKLLEQIKLLSFNDFLKNNEQKCYGQFSEPIARFMLNEFEIEDFVGISEKRLKEIIAMDLEVEHYVNDDEKLYISTSVKKEKVSGKDSFVVYFDSFPNTYDFEENSTYLKVYAFDVTDLDKQEYEDIYYETEDYEDNPKLENYIRDNCNVIKTNNFDWSEGSSILVQKKLINPYDDPPEKIAFPFSVMNFPKAGKRKIAFRTFICKKELKFHENEGRPLDYKMVNYRPEHFKLNEYQDNFDEYDSYPDILAYDATEIDAEYKQAGYLGVNRQKLDTLIIPIGYAIANINNDPLKSIQLVKDEIAYKGDRSLEGGINQVLHLKKVYEQAKKSKIDPQVFLDKIKNYSKIDERYEVINLLLNIATDDKTLTLEENKFLDNAAKKLELNQNKYLEIKKIETSSLTFVDFGDKADESIFGLSDNMDAKEKCRVLRKEYSRWNSQTNNSDKNKRVRAKEMVNLIANLRKQYNC